MRLLQLILTLVLVVVSGLCECEKGGKCYVVCNNLTVQKQHNFLGTPCKCKCVSVLLFAYTRVKTKVCN